MKFVFDNVTRSGSLCNRIFNLNVLMTAIIVDVECKLIVINSYLIKVDHISNI